MSNEQTIHSSTKAHRSERTDHNVIAMYILKSLGLSVSETDNKIGDSTSTPRTVLGALYGHSHRIV
jgi:hypothetical protein